MNPSGTRRSAAFHTCRNRRGVHVLHTGALLGGLLLLAFGLAACDLFREQVSGATPTPVVIQVSADQIARAMQEDHFFSDYRSGTLLVQGTILAVSQQDSTTTVALSTSLATGVLCEVQNNSATLHAGDAITVSAPADDAQRATNAVLLKNCSIP